MNEESLSLSATERQQMEHKHQVDCRRNSLVPLEASLKKKNVVKTEAGKFDRLEMGLQCNNGKAATFSA